MKRNPGRNIGWPALALVGGALLASTSCHRAGIEYRPARTVVKLPGASVVATSDAAYRLIISPSLRNAPSRLWVVHAKIETFDNVPLRMPPGGAQLVLEDGTRLRPLDQARVVALLNRTEIGKGALGHGEARFPSGDLSDDEKERIRSAILASPLVARELSRSQPIEGYMVVDMKSELASLEGVQLEVVATRLQDGAFVRRVYRFGEQTHAQAATSMVRP